MTGIRIGVIGDLHTHWDQVDVAQFERSDYDLLYFTGDLGGGTRDSSLRVARNLSRLGRATLVMPGNNDVGDIAELAAELAYRGGIQRLAAMRRGRDTDGAADSPAPVQLCGYSAHRLRRGDVDVTVIAARPHSMGGPTLAFAGHMRDAWGIDSMEASTRRLCALVDGAETRDLVFFAHNGPTGLGEDAHAMWGCDFRPGGGDWGDPDLAAAIAHALAGGRRVLAVVAGHMHLRTKCGRERPWCEERDGTLYVNAARVPRIFASEDDTHRHHVALEIGARGVSAVERFVPQQG